MFVIAHAADPVLRPGRTGTNCEEIRVRSYIPGSATVQGTVSLTFP